MDKKLLQSVYNRELKTRIFQQDGYMTSTTKSVFNALFDRSDFIYTLYPLITAYERKDIRLFIQSDYLDNTNALIKMNLQESDTHLPQIFITYLNRYNWSDCGTLENALDRAPRGTRIAELKTYLADETIDVTEVAEQILNHYEKTSAFAKYNPEKRILWIGIMKDNDSSLQVQPVVHSLIVAQFLMARYITEDETVRHLIEKTYQQAITHKSSTAAQFPELYKDIINHYVKATEVNNPIRAHAEKMKLQTQEKLKAQLDSKEREYRSAMNQATEYARYVNDLRNSLHIATFRDVDIPDIMEAIDGIKDLRLMYLDDQNRRNALLLLIETTLNVDPTLVSTNMVKNPTALQFYQLLIDGTISVPIQETIRLYMDINTMEIEKADNQYEPTIPETIQNPHHEQFGCFGNYKHSVLQAMQSNNWYGIVQTLVDSARQLNLADSTVRSSFEERYLTGYSTRNMPIIFNETKEVFLWHKFIETYNQQKNEVHFVEAETEQLQPEGHPDPVGEQGIPGTPLTLAEITRDIQTALDPMQALQRHLHLGLLNLEEARDLLNMLQTDTALDGPEELDLYDTRGEN